MNIQIVSLSTIAALLLAADVFTPTASAQPAVQPAAARARGPQGPQLVSPEVAADRRVTFRILAPKAETVKLSGDIHNAGQSAFVKGTNGVWEMTLGPLDPGAYRYTFNVDGVTVNDSRNPATSESNNNTSSLLTVPGSDLMDAKDVPHGAVASVTYYSKALQRSRRMHVYTPPGYQLGGGKFPVLYLLHGAGDSDDSWTSIGRAGFILDNMIAAHQAKPMVVVMPAGHTRAFGFGQRGATPAGGTAQPPADEFADDFMTDIMPYIEKNYRVYTDRPNRAIGGLSMGGMQTRKISLAHLDLFSHICVLSGGSIAPTDIPDMTSFKQSGKLVFISYGSRENGATAKANVEALKQAGVNSVFYESPDTAHEWVTWRRSLIQFAPLLFKD
jgi:enterochelin esterase-like enzyme